MATLTSFLRRAVLAGTALAVLGGAALPGPASAAPAASEGIEAGWTATGSYLAGRQAQQSDDWSSAARFMGTALAFEPDNVELMRRAALLFLGSGEAEKAVTLARRLVREERTPHMAVALVAAADLRDGNVAQAAGLVEGGLPNDGLGQYVGPLVQAWVEAAAGRHGEALSRLAPLATAQGFAQLHDLHAGLLQELAGDMSAAEAAYARAVRAGATLRVIQIVGGFYERAGKPEEARLLYETFRTSTTDPLLIDPAIERLEAGGTAPRIVSDAREGMAEAMFDLASALHQERVGELATLYGRIALFLRPDFPLARLMIADVLAEEGQAEASIAEYREVEGEPGLRWAARLRIAEQLETLGRTDEAVELLNAMAAERPERTDALASLGDLYRATKRFEEAVGAYDAAIGRIGTPEERHWLVYYSRGVALEQSGRWQEAETDLLRALDLAPDQPYLLNYLGYSWVDRGVNLERAKAMIARAVELRPTDGYIVDSLGWALYRLGDHEGAVAQLERAVELQPLDATINDHLGDAYWQVGRAAEARFQWQRALMVAEEPKLQADIRAKLEKGLDRRMTAETRATGAEAVD
jgi:tetratricopeptide (TPR) repeat protein